MNIGRKTIKWKKKAVLFGETEIIVYFCRQIMTESLTNN